MVKNEYENKISNLKSNFSIGLGLNYISRSNKFKDKTFASNSFEVEEN